MVSNSAAKGVYGFSFTVLDDGTWKRDSIVKVTKMAQKLSSDKRSYPSSSVVRLTFILDYLSDEM